MGQLLPNYKKAIYDDLVLNISANNARYYAFASNPHLGNTTFIDLDSTVFDTEFASTWTLLFGKKIANTDIVPVIERIDWAANTVYTRYDNTSDELTNDDFYVVVPPSLEGGYYHVYKCIDNANGAVSTQKPDQQQLATFTKSDGYTWKYMYSVSSSEYTKFATQTYFPIVPNTAIQNGADDYTGLDNIVITNRGNGYDSYHNGVVRSVVNSTVIQVAANASTDNNFYAKNGIYLYNISSATSQLRVVQQYVSNLSGNWVYLNEPANTQNITSGSTQYTISPRVKFDTDGDEVPLAYSVVNASANNIGSIVIIDRGNGITRATATLESNNVYGSGSEVYCIVPPPGGHGSNPANELHMKAISVGFQFANTESGVISTNCAFTQIGLIKNPSTLNANNTKGSLFTSNAFSQLLEANVVLPQTLSVGQYVLGNTSGARGQVVTSNSSYIELVGDKAFSNGEVIYSEDDPTVFGTITLNTRGGIYPKDLTPLYVNNINNVERTVEQTESFKIIIQV